MKGVITAGNKHTAHAGAEILKAGGKRLRCGSGSWLDEFRGRMPADLGWRWRFPHGI